MQRLCMHILIWISAVLTAIDLSISKRNFQMYVTLNGLLVMRLFNVSLLNQTIHAVMMLYKYIVISLSLIPINERPSEITDLNILILMCHTLQIFIGIYSIALNPKRAPDERARCARLHTKIGYLSILVELCVWVLDMIINGIAVSITIGIINFLLFVNMMAFSMWLEKKETSFKDINARLQRRSLLRPPRGL